MASCWFLILASILPPLTSLGSTTSSPTQIVYKSYQNSIYCTPSTDIQAPENVSALEEIVRNAIATGQTVKAFGSRHSITDTICTDGIPISMANINYAIDSNDGTVTFGAGIELIDAMEFLQGLGKNLIHIPAFAGITIGGAIGTGAHGSSLLHPTSLSDQIVRLTIIDGSGTTRTIDNSNPSDLNAFRVHLGLLGIIVDVTLQTVPLFKMTVSNQLHPDSVLFDGSALQWANQNDWFEMWWFPQNSHIVVSKGTYIPDLTTPGNAYTNLIPDEDPLLITTTTQAFETLQATRNKVGLYAFEEFTKLSLFSMVVGKPPVYTEDGLTLKNPATGYAWRLQSNKCTNKCAWNNGDGNSILPEESSMAFDISQFPGVFNMIKNVLAQYPTAFEMIGIFVRFSKASDALMAISSGRQTFTIEWTKPMRRNPYTTARDGIGAYQAILQEMVTNYGGRPHWGKNGLHYFTQQVFASTLPNRVAFTQAMTKFDPNGIFLNKFGHRILGNSDDVDKDPSATRCALQDYCICSSGADCAPLQTCARVNGFRVCKDLVSINPPPLHFPDLRNLTSILEVIGAIQ